MEFSGREFKRSQLPYTCNVGISSLLELWYLGLGLVYGVNVRVRIVRVRVVRVRVGLGFKGG